MLGFCGLSFGGDGGWKGGKGSVLFWVCLVGWFFGGVVFVVYIILFWGIFLFVCGVFSGFIFV